MYETLIQIRGFRIVRNIGNNHKPMDTIIQHSCGNPLDTSLLYCDPSNGWYYCWHHERKCCGCNTPVPDEVAGLLALHEWER